MCIQCGNPWHIADATDGGVSSSAPTSHLDPTQAGAQITRHDYHWGSTLGAVAGPITFGFRASAPTYNSTSNEQGTFSQFTTQETAAAEYAMRMWADLANISFSDVNPGGYTNNAAILFGNYRSTTDQSQAFAYFPSSNNQSAASSQGDVWLNINYEHTTNLLAGSYDLMTLIHEIGHSLGLEHPGVYNAGSGQTITYANSAQYVEDTRQYTVMSYFEASNTGANHVYARHTIYASTPLLDDITAIQRLYGANTSYATGDTTYGFHSNADVAFQLTSSNQQAVFTIWDGGGNDTLDFSGYSTNQIIDLLPGTFSSIGALTLNVSIAVGTIIENVVGGSGNDTIYENSSNNIINGGAGSDTLVFTGAHSQYQTTLNQDGSLTLADARPGAPDGTDTAIGIEYFQFSDGAYTSDQLVQSHAANHIIYGGAGADVLRGSAENDWYFVYNANDVIIEAAGQGTSDRVFASVSFTLTPGAEVEVMSTTDNVGTTPINLTGNEFAQSIYGNAGDNILHGGGGGDSLVGFDGNDLYFVDDARDIVFEAAHQGNDRVFASVSWNMTPGSEIEMLTTADNAGTQSINLRGNEFANTIVGNAGVNIISGGFGNDTLIGLGGNDYFLFEHATAGNDQIADFTVGQDHIALVHSAFTSLPTGTLSDANFLVRGTTAQDANDFVIYDQSAGAVFYDADGSGADAPVQIASVTANLALHASDFVTV